LDDWLASGDPEAFLDVERNPALNQPSLESWDEFLALLKKKIEEREVARADIEKSIQILKDAEQELRQQHFAPPHQDDEKRDHLPYRISATSPRGDMPEDTGTHKVLGPLNELDEITLIRKNDTPATPDENTIDITERPKLVNNPVTSPPDAGSAPPDKVDEALQDEQIFLLGGRRFSGKAPLDPQRFAPTDNPAPAPAFLSTIEGDLDLDVPQPVFAKSHTNGKHTNGGHSNGGPKLAVSKPVAPKPAAPLINKELPAALDQLMNYIRGGGAIRCQDPWGQNCAAFLLTTIDTSVVATDVFLNYLRKSIQEMKRIHDESLMKGAATSRNTEKYEELENRKRFLATLAEGMLRLNLSALVEVPGLKITGQETPPGRFDFENSTKDFLHPGFLNALVVLLKKSPDKFFLLGGGYFEITDFLGQYKNFTRETGEEALAVAMLEQLGQRVAKETARASGPPTPPPATLQPAAPAPCAESEAVDLMLGDEMLELDNPEEHEVPGAGGKDTESFSLDDLENLLDKEN
jgi:hypothetical protein